MTSAWGPLAAGRDRAERAPDARSILAERAHDYPHVALQALNERSYEWPNSSRRRCLATPASSTRPT